MCYIEHMNDDEELNTAAPFRKGEWVAETGCGQPAFGKVRECFFCQIDKKWCFNLVLYSLNGDKIGRMSPSNGDPSTFEPGCPCDRYAKIKQPLFPIKRDSWSGNYNQSLSYGP